LKNERRRRSIERWRKKKRPGVEKNLKRPSRGDSSHGGNNIFSQYPGGIV
jgi:hypothetical protein